MWSQAAMTQTRPCRTSGTARRRPCPPLRLQSVLLAAVVCRAPCHRSVGSRSSACAALLSLACALTHANSTNPLMNMSGAAANAGDGGTAAKDAPAGAGECLVAQRIDLPDSRGRSLLAPTSSPSPAASPRPPPRAAHACRSQGTSTRPLTHRLRHHCAALPPPTYKLLI